MRMPQGAEAVGGDEFTQATLAGGQVLFLVMSWIHAMREHGRMVRAALGRLGLEEKVNLRQTSDTTCDKLATVLATILGLRVSHWRAISRWSEGPGTLARWECGEQAPRLDFAERIKEFLAISEVPSLSTNAGIA
jgi:hypothetical protein